MANGIDELKAANKKFGEIVFEGISDANIKKLVGTLQLSVARASNDLKKSEGSLSVETCVDLYIAFKDFENKYVSNNIQQITAINNVLEKLLVLVDESNRAEVQQRIDEYQQRVAGYQQSQQKFSATKNATMFRSPERKSTIVPSAEADVKRSPSSKH